MDGFLSLLLNNFGMAMVILAIACVLLNWLFARKSNFFELLFRWFVLFPLGVTAIYAFIFHAFFPKFTAETIGWANSPFQFEVAIANLALGVIAILAFKADYSFRLAVVIANSLWLWGDAVGHIYQMILKHNYAVGNAGSWFWLDLLLPFILMIALKGSQRKSKDYL